MSSELARPRPSVQRREHPAAVLHETLGSLRDIVVPLLVALLVSGDLTRAPLFALAGLGISLAGGYARWRARRHWIEDGAFHQRSGVFTPDVTTVPLARITAVDETQGIAQRLGRVVALDIQTAGGGAAGEIVIRALSHEDAAALRRALGHGADDDALAAPERPAPARGPAEPAWRMTRGDLVRTAVTTPQTGLIVSLLGVTGLIAGELAEDQRTDDLVDALPDDPLTWVLLVALALAAAGVLALLGAVVAYGGFEVTREPDRLRIRRGLVERRASSVLVGRVHAIRIDRSPLRRLLGLCRVRLDVAGYASERAVAQTLLPICRRDAVVGLLGELLPELPLPDVTPSRPPRRAVGPYAAGPAVAVAAVLAVAVGFAVGLGAPAATWGAVPALALVVLVHGTARRRAAACAVGPAVATLTTLRRLSLTTTVALVGRLQSRELRATILQTRRDLASVGVGIGSGRTVTVAHLDAAEAARAFAALDPLRATRERDTESRLRIL